MDREVEIMRVSRISPMARLIVGVGGQRLESLGEARDPEVRGRLLAAVGELIEFVGGYQVLVDAGVAPEQPQALRSTPEKLSEPTKSQQDFLESLERQTGAMRAVAEQVRMDKKRATAEPAKEEAATSLGLAEQIEAILQRRLSVDNNLAGRNIHIMSSPGGGLRIQVDGMLFRSIDEVVETRVKEAIIAARREWEAGAEGRSALSSL